MLAACLSLKATATGQALGNGSKTYNETWEQAASGTAVQLYSWDPVIYLFRIHDKSELRAKRKTNTRL